MSEETGRAARAYKIEGGRSLNGTIRVSGAKNAIGKQLIASLLTQEPCEFTNVPRIREIDVILGMLSDVGTEHEWIGENALMVHTDAIRSTVVTEKYSGVNRIPILLLAPLFYRAESATVPLVGGCRIGPRPVDFHVDILRRMGGKIEEGERSYTLSGHSLRGTTISLPYPSVGATETALLAAVLAKGSTVISNAAMEPEVMDTVLFLQKMGALIRVDVDRQILVEGVAELRGARHRAIPDRIEVASFAAAAAATDGSIEIQGFRQDHMITFLNLFRRAGGAFEIQDDTIRFSAGPDGLKAVHFDTDVHPGVMTDWQQPFVVMLTQARGASVIHETVYENRFGYTEALRKMGANIQVSSECLGNKECRFLHSNHQHSCIVSGPTPLRGGKIEMPDLRAGFAYLIAALVAEGTSSVSGISYIERGYSDVVGKLESVGASISVVG